MIDLPSHVPERSGQRGMTLIEILVAIVVMSIGLLGLAGLQVKGIQVNQGSIFRSQASLLAEDMADRMRSDSTGAKAGNYTLSTPTSTPTATGATLAAITEWQAQVAALPGGQATIIPVAGNVMQITVGWVDTRAQGGAGVPTTTTTSTLASFTLTTELFD
jgi:type IV pilus assembly protein PilV